MTGRIGVTAAAAVLAAWAVFHFAWHPYRCNAEVSAIEAATLAAEQVADTYGRTVRARRNLQRLAGLRESCGNEVRVPVLIGANQEILGRLPDAELMYRKALSIEQRPEIYTALARVQIQRGQIDAAVESYTTAARFHRPVLDEIRSEELQRRILERLPPSP